MKKYQVFAYFFILGILILTLHSRLFAPNSKNENQATSRSDTVNNKTDNDPIKTDFNDYTWPTDASERVTSSFAEYRSTHFHGGIDISTNGQTGYKVFATRDGFVYRIRITPNGYGKMLYIKHPDGYVSTYAHLKGFNNEITTLAREEQYKRGTYEIDLVMDKPRLNVKKGEVIAYTGDTGFGPPHLHFEVRDENLNPINPMLCDKFAVQDNIPPFIKRVMISPIGYYSMVENSNTPKYFSRFPRRKTNLKIPQSIRVQGKIAFGVEAQDLSDGSWSRAGIHRMELYLDDSLAFAMQLDRVPADETKMILLHYDLPTILEGHGKFQKLYVDTGNSLPFYEHRPDGAGIINSEKLNEGEHYYKIVCKDFTGNQCVLTGTLLVSYKPSIQIDHASNDELFISGTKLNSIYKFYVFGKRNNEFAWTQHTISKERFDITNTNIIIPVDLKRYDVFKVVAETKYGLLTAPIFHFIRKPNGGVRPINIGTEIFNDYVKVTATSAGQFTSIPKCTIQENSSQQSIQLQAVDLNKYTGIFTPSDSYVGKRTIRVDGEINGIQTSASDEVTLYSIPTKQAGSFSFDNRNLNISYDSGAVFKPLHMRINKELNHRSTIYTLGPDDVLLNRGITVSLSSNGNPIADHSALYFRSTAGWIFQTSKLDSGRKSFSTTLTRTLGEVAILQDDESPLIGRLRILPRSGKVFISFRYYDNLSGVDTDEIKMYIDNNMIIPEIDGERRSVWYQADERINRGRHTLSVTIKDRQKNEASVTRAFTVK
jgi:hypothetical protein